MTGRGLSPAAGLGARLRWARSSSGGEERTSEPKTSTSSWEKNVVGRGPSSDSGRPIILMFWRLLRPSRSASFVLSDMLSCRRAAVASSNCWRRSTTSLALSSKELIRCPWSATVEFNPSSVVVRASKDDLKSADIAFLCSSSKELSSASVTPADGEEASLSCLPFVLDIVEASKIVGIITLAFCKLLFRKGEVLRVN